MFHDLRASATFPGKADCGREYALAPLSCLYSPSQEASPIAHALDMVQDRNGGVSSEDEVAVHAMRQEDRIIVRRAGRWDCGLSCR